MILDDMLPINRLVLKKKNEVAITKMNDYSNN